MESKEFVVFALFPHIIRRKGGFSKNFLSITVAVCKAAIQTQEKKTFVNSGWFFLANYAIIYLIMK